VTTSDSHLRQSESASHTQPGQSLW